jgi:WS/DGAT/MGAT family acyltransferase
LAAVHYERLSALDASFLGVEVPNARMHEAAVMIFDPGPLATEDGGVDVERISRGYQAKLGQVERYRQRLAYIPLFAHPVWVDDPSFNIRYHIRHISLPKPGNERLLKRVAGYILSQPLDLRKPLWELWVIEGLEEGRFAMVGKVHHCMADGRTGMGILGALLRPDPDPTLEQAEAWEPRPAPGGLELLRGEIGRRMRAPFELLKPLRRPTEALQSAQDVASGIIEASRLGWRAASKTPLNPDQIGPHRRFDWTSVGLDGLKDVKNRLGGTINDVVLAAAAGALGEFLRAHHTSPKELDFRALVPVNVRSGAQAKRLGNHVAMMMAELPVGERDPYKRLRRVIQTTQRLKKSHQAQGVKWIQEFTDWVSTDLFINAIRVATRARPFNIAVTNVPGPPFALYMLGARLRTLYPMMPIFSNQGRPSGDSTRTGIRFPTFTISSKISRSRSSSSGRRPPGFPRTSGACAGRSNERGPAEAL